MQFWETASQVTERLEIAHCVEVMEMADMALSGNKNLLRISVTWTALKTSGKPILKFLFHFVVSFFQCVVKYRRGRNTSEVLNVQWHYGLN